VKKEICTFLIIDYAKMKGLKKKHGYAGKRDFWAIVIFENRPFKENLPVSGGTLDNLKSASFSLYHSIATALVKSAFLHAS
jgi:hypothetical protein